MRLPLLFILMCLSLTPAVMADGRQQEEKQQANKCDFSEYKALRISDYKFPVRQQVKAEYPPLAIAAKVSGTVPVIILVDQAGGIVRACATEGHPLLKASAVAAARKWQFAPDFGLRFGHRIKYMRALILFNFAL